MRIWYDACTGKHVRYASEISKRLRKKGHEIIFTTRRHPDTIPLAKILDEKPIVVGEYNPSSLSSRLEESAKRIIEFSRMFRENPPDIAIAHQSVELCRTAFGLDIPIILTADTPHAIAVNQLTLPFASRVVISKAIPDSFLKKYGVKNIIYFDGVDEVAWIKNFKPKPIPKQKKSLLIVRQIESKAVYAKNQIDFSSIIIKKLESLGNVQFISRFYKKEEKIKNKEFIDSANLVANADLVISAGGTLAREAALQGVPSLVVSEIGKTYVNTYLAKKGFPLFFIDPYEVLDHAKRHIGKRLDVSAKMHKLENPISKIEKIVQEISQ
jgi:predicted glycosyltransferase